MTIENRCKNCNHTWDGHWHNYPGTTPGEYLRESRVCPRCHSTRTISISDESGDIHQGGNELCQQSTHPPHGKS